MSPRPCARPACSERAARHASLGRREAASKVAPRAATRRNMLRSIFVFAGSSIGRNPEFAEAAADLGAAIGSRGWMLVYGGASIGLMGAVADAALAAGAPVVGILPEFLAHKELAHQ